MVMHLRQLVHQASIAAVATAGGPTFVPIAHATRRLTSPLFFSSSSSTAQQAPPPTRYLLSYDYVPDVLEKRGPYREGHLGLAKAMIEGDVRQRRTDVAPGRGRSQGALFVFTTKDAAEKFVTEDPYVSNGIVVGHSISEWTVVVGDN